jgi:probable phosphomutase (TIGR03848 family)
VDERLGECKYGDWTGRPLRALAREKLWKVVQSYPSSAAFPGEGGEPLREMQSRAVEAVRHWDARLAAAHGPDAVWVACSHGDVIKAVVADALGLHLDLFQRVVVDPGSVTAIRYTSERPFLLRLNDVGGGLAGYLPPRRRRRRSSQRAGEAPVGGGTGAEEAGA